MTARHIDPRHRLREKRNARGYRGARDVLLAVALALLALAVTGYGFARVLLVVP